MPSQAPAVPPLEVAAWALIIATLVVVLTATGVAVAAYFQRQPRPRVWAATRDARRALADQRERRRAYGPAAERVARQLAASGEPALASAAPRAQWPYPEGPVVDVTPATPQEFAAALAALGVVGGTLGVPGAPGAPLHTVKLDYDGVRIVVDAPPREGETPPERLPPVAPEELTPDELLVLGALEALTGAVYYPKRTSRKATVAAASATRPAAAYAVKLPAACTDPSALQN